LFPRSPSRPTRQRRLELDAGLRGDEDFAESYPRDGRPGLSPVPLATVSALQFLLELSDWQVAEAVRYLEPHFEAAMAEVPLPEPLAYLGTYAPDALLRRRPEASRWLALAVLKNDTELPYVLVAIVR
jgi:hypothetical protein